MTQVRAVDWRYESPVPTDAVRSWRWAKVVGVALLSVAIVGVPTDVIDTAWFTRMTPVRWWEYPVLVLTATLTGMWFAVAGRVTDRGRTGMLGSSALSALAVGCPLCNMIVVGLLGASGALGIWASIQPVLALFSLAALGAAVIVRWRKRKCDTQDCYAPEGRL